LISAAVTENGQANCSALLSLRWPCLLCAADAALLLPSVRRRLTALVEPDDDGNNHSDAKY